MYEDTIKTSDLSTLETVHGITNADRQPRREKKKRGKSPRKRKQDQVEISVLNKNKDSGPDIGRSSNVTENSNREGSENQKHIDIVVR